MAGWPRFASAGRGKSGLHGSTVPGNARRGQPQGQCHRKQTAGPRERFRRSARVKGCGKSAPRRRQRRRHGKPHREQDQVGTAARASGRGGFRPAVRVGRARRPATDVPEEWPSLAGDGKDRTRLTGRLAPVFSMTGCRLHGAAPGRPVQLMRASIGAPRIFIRPRPQEHLENKMEIETKRRESGHRPGIGQTNR